MQYIQSPDDFKLYVLQWISYSAKVFSDNSDDYPKWFSNFTNPYKYICNLLSENLIELCDIRERLCRLNLKELRVILSENGLQTTGKKEQIIDRIVNCINPDLITIPNAVKISESGSAFIEIQSEKKFACELLCYGISAREYYETKQRFPEFSKEDVLYELLITKQNEPSDFSTLYNIQSALREKCIAKNDKKSAMLHTVYLAYYNLCTEYGIELNFEGLPIRVGNQLFELKDYFDDTMIKKCESLPLPYNHFPPQISNFKRVVKKYV